MEAENQNPFVAIEKKLNRLEVLMKGLYEQKPVKGRIVDINEFAKHSRMAKSTIYIKLSKGESIPGAFKAGRKIWSFDLDKWDAYIRERAEQMAG